MERRPLNAQRADWMEPVVEVPLTQAFPQFNDVKEYRSKKCIFNADRTRLYNVTSPKYQVIGHMDALDTITKALELSFGEKVKPLVRSLAGGARIRAEFKLPFAGKIDIGNGDVSDLNLVVRNSYDGMWKFSAVLGAFRLVCSNGMVIGQKFGSVSGKHFPGMGNPEDFAKRLQSMIENGAQLAPLWSQWREEKVEHEWAMDLLEAKIPAKYSNRILAEGTFPKSKWDFYNELTYASTHLTSTVNRRIEFDDVISKMFYDDVPKLQLAEV